MVLESVFGGDRQPEMFHPDQGCHFSSHRLLDPPTGRGDQDQLVGEKALRRQHPEGEALANRQRGS